MGEIGAVRKRSRSETVAHDSSTGEILVITMTVVHLLTWSGFCFKTCATFRSAFTVLDHTLVENCSKVIEFTINFDSWSQEQYISYYNNDFCLM